MQNARILPGCIVDLHYKYSRKCLFDGERAYLRDLPDRPKNRRNCEGWVKPEFTGNRIRAILSQYPIEADIDVEVCLCREKLNAAISVLKPHSLILIGGRTRFWPTEEYRLARGLRRRGYEVVFVEQPAYQ